MAGQKIVVMTANQLCLNGFAYKQYALMVKNLIDFVITVGLLLPQFLRFAVSLLQFLQPKPHTTNTGFINSFISKLDLEGSLEIPKLWQSIGFAD